jgi:hypothetical protein
LKAGSPLMSSASAMRSKTAAISRFFTGAYCLNP